MPTTPPSTFIVEARQYNDDQARIVIHNVFTWSASGEQPPHCPGFVGQAIVENSVQQRVLLFPIHGVTTVLEAFQHWEAARDAEIKRLNQQLLLPGGGDHADRPHHARAGR